MKELYLVTGATGNLGRVVVGKLLEKGKQVRCLVLPGEESQCPSGVTLFTGDVRDRESLRPAFLVGPEEALTVIHCAGVISIASHNSKQLWEVNVGGTRNITDLCVEYGVTKLVYVSSVHALPEHPAGEDISESREFSAERVVGEYAKSKAEATAYVLRAAQKGLNASVVHPSGIIGPYDAGHGNFTAMMIAYCNGTLPAGVRGGYDFVDVRDVADGILACCEKGKRGECYILSGRYLSVEDVFNYLHRAAGGQRIRLYLPRWVARAVAPLYEKYCLWKKKPLYFTPYSIYTLGTNASFSHEKATRELGYLPRRMQETFTDTVRWLRENGFILPRRKKKKAGA